MSSASLLFFFFKQKTAYELRISDWSSDVCSSDLLDGRDQVLRRHVVGVGHLGLLGGVVDRGRDAVEFVELALDPVGARGAGHPGDRELDRTGGGRASWLTLRGHCFSPDGVVGQ